MPNSAIKISKPKVCIFFSDTGGGHRSAAEAIREAINELGASLPAKQQAEVVLDNVVEKSHFLSRLFVRFYNYLLKCHQDQMWHYYWFVQAARPNELRPYYLLVRNYIYKLVKAHGASTIVSVHPMLNRYLAWAVKDMGLLGKVRLITVVTDPNEYLWTGWSCSDMDLIIAPNDLARNKLVQLGTPPERIKIMGMPVNPAFVKKPIVPRNQFLSLLGLDPDTCTICINAGWAGGGNMLKVYQNLGSVKKKIQVIFVCGNNGVLFAAAEKLAQTFSVPTAVLPVHDYMSDLMNACDLMVTKAGGLTTFECIARGLPMALDLITSAMPQEKGTADMLIEQGLAVPIRKPKDIIDAIDYKLNGLRQKALALPTTHSLDNTHAVYDIAQTILNSCDPNYDLLRQPARIFRKEEFFDSRVVV
jgi:UDP-N-acetylglucosamine:LPS N-acetylglucosamine transferase